MSNITTPAHPTHLTVAQLTRLLAAWSYALRHGDYPKITGQLVRSHARLATITRDEDFTTEIQPAGWCAMGVLCDLIVNPCGPTSPIPGEGSLFGQGCTPFLPAPMKMELMDGQYVDWYRFTLNVIESSTLVPDNEFLEPAYERAWQMESQSLPVALAHLLHLEPGELDEISKRNDGFAATSHCVGFEDGEAVMEEEPAIPMQSFPEIADWLDREVIPCLIARAEHLAYLHGHE